MKIIRRLQEEEREREREKKKEIKKKGRVNRKLEANLKIKARSAHTQSTFTKSLIDEQLLQRKLDKKNQYGEQQGDNDPKQLKFNLFKNYDGKIEGFIFLLLLVCVYIYILS